MREISSFEMNVKSELLKKRITITELAQQLGISVAYCSDIIRGNRNAQHLRKQICKILKIKEV
jgi:plasmid maintenance system antidote protein VapI